MHLLSSTNNQIPSYTARMAQTRPCLHRKNRLDQVTRDCEQNTFQTSKIPG